MCKQPWSRTQIALIAAPPLLAASAWAVFRCASARLGRRRGYAAGFLFYWIGWCFLLPLWALGWKGLRAMFRRPDPGRRGCAVAAALVGPVIVPLLTTFPAELRRTTPKTLAASAARSLVNGTAEEILWRGMYAAAFPGDPVWGTLYPSVMFGLWHLAPQAVVPYKGPGGPGFFAFMAVFLGLAWGWAAQRTGSIRWTTAAHILNNFFTLPGRDFLEE